MLAIVPFGPLGVYESEPPSRDLLVEALREGESLRRISLVMTQREA